MKHNVLSNPRVYVTNKTKIHQTVQTENTRLKSM